MAPGLLGPPELQSTISAVDQTTPNKSQPSIDIITTPTSYTSTGNPCLDFFHVAPKTPQKELIERLQLSYQKNPTKTLKLICNLRGVKGSGKNNIEGFYACALWLHENHPKTLANNVGLFASFGSLKDLLEVLFRVLEGLEARKTMKDLWEADKTNFFAKRWGATKTKLSELDEAKRKAVKAEKKAKKAKKAVDRYSHDPEYKYLYDCVCDVFANLLREDLKLLQKDRTEGCRDKLSLAAKWCPSLDSSYDEYLLICETIGKKVFPREEYLEYGDDVEEAHYAYRVRTRLRKEVLVPLRKALELPEVYMCAKRWRDIPYDRVSSSAMSSLKKVFLKRDSNRFEEYLEEVRDGASSINAGAMLPHEIISGVSKGDYELDQVLELQWKRTVDDLAKQGKLVNSFSVCDNMESDACVALMLLVSELTGEPWKGKMLKEDGVVEIEGEKLDSKVDFMREYYISRIDLHSVFDSILEYADKNKLGENEMVKTVFVISENEIGLIWEEEYPEILGKFVDKGYQKVPEVVFWNVKNSQGGVTVKCDQPGVAVVSGASKNMLTLFFQGVAGDLTPEGVMDAAISRPEYDSIVVHD